MNMITVLLGATGFLLLVAVVLSFGKMQQQTDSGEAERLRQEIAALEATRNLATQGTLPVPSAVPSPVPSAVPSTVPVPAPLPAPIDNPAIVATPDPGFPATPADASLEFPDIGEDTAEEADALAAQIAAEERAFKEGQLRFENDRLKKDNQVLRNEVGVAWQSRIATDAKNMARANTITSATLLARVTQWDKEHGFAVIDLLQPELVQAGTILAIRRQTGIYGQITIDQMYPGSQATANPIINTFLGEEGVNVQPGDELILPPP